MNLKEIFDKAENGTLTYAQFEALAKESGAKFTDISEGKYVSKSKYDDDLAAKDTQIQTLNSTIGTRDTDLADLKSKLEAAGTDAEKLTTLTNDFTALQGKYDADVKNYKAQLKKQAYEFAVKEFAGTKKFTSNAAKRDFINSMIAKNLTMEKDKIMGADDFVAAYSSDNADAFVVEESKETVKPKPTFVSPTQGAEDTQTPSGFSGAFHFQGVRPHDE